jgi:aryl-phospho-beta-D-glucosidase BglC (GH1 family)
MLKLLLRSSWLVRLLGGLLLLCLGINSLFFPAAPQRARQPFGAEDFLKTHGRLIKNRAGKGDVVYLRGTNAGGWLVHEEWMCPTQAPDQKTIRDTLDERFGPAQRDAMLQVYRAAYWQEADFDRCAAMGMTCLRLPFLYWDVMDEDAALLPNAFQWLDWFVAQCGQRGLYVILDLHGAFGSQNGKHHSGQVNDGRQLYYNEKNRAKTLRLWQALAAHYKGNPAVAGYDLLNEPENDTGRTGRLQWDYYDELYKAVRAVDPDHMIFLEACWEVTAMPHPRRYGWTNVVYEYHHYAWMMQETADQVVLHSAAAVLLESVRNFGVPTFIGEFTCFGKDEAWRRVLQ